MYDLVNDEFNISSTGGDWKTRAQQLFLLTTRLSNLGSKLTIGLFVVVKDTINQSIFHSFFSRHEIVTIQIT